MKNKPLTINRKPKGFTLIELLVVISIIGILAAFALASFSSAQARGRDAQRKNDFEQIQKALELAKNDSSGASYYPNTIPAGGSAWSTYMKRVPLDPKNSGANVYAYTAGPAACTTACTTYTLTTALENATDPSDTSSQTNCGIAAASIVNDRYMTCEP